MSAGRDRPYPYNRAEWLGVFLALVGTPGLVTGLFLDRANIPSSLGIDLGVGFGLVAALGWTLLGLGRRAHLRAAGPASD
jgi:drug/metabolite transporter (DMT)-like permease